MGNFISTTLYATQLQIKSFGASSPVHLLSSSDECSMARNQINATSIKEPIAKPSNIIKNENIDICYNNYKYGNWILYIN